MPLKAARCGELKEGDAAKESKVGQMLDELSARAMADDTAYTPLLPLPLPWEAAEAVVSEATSELPVSWPL